MILDLTKSTVLFYKVYDDTIKFLDRPVGLFPELIELNIGGFGFIFVLVNLLYTN